MKSKPKLILVMIIEPRRENGTNPYFNYSYSIVNAKKREFFLFLPYILEKIIISRFKLKYLGKILAHDMQHLHHKIIMTCIL